MEFLDEEHVINIHDEMIKDFGGLMGQSKERPLDSILHRIKNHITYEGLEDLFEIAALYVISIARGHPFNDGNKRTAMVVMIDFFDLNGIRFNAKDNEEIEQIIVDIAEGKLDRYYVSNWLKNQVK